MQNFNHILPSVLVQKALKRLWITVQLFMNVASFPILKGHENEAPPKDQQVFWSVIFRVKVWMLWVHVYMLWENIESIRLSKVGAASEDELPAPAAGQKNY